MRTRAIKAKWAKKLLSSKYFVLLTDKESAIMLDGVDPESFNDRVALSAQRAELKMFSKQLTALIKDHDWVLQQMSKAEGSN